VLSVLAIVPLAALLSHATESVAAKTGDAVGGLLNATLGNLTELVIALTALRAGQYMLVKRPLPARSSPTACSCWGRPSSSAAQAPHPGVQQGRRPLPGRPALPGHGRTPGSLRDNEGRLPAAAAFAQELSLGLAVLLIVAYALACCSRSRRTASSSQCGVR